MNKFPSEISAWKNDVARRLVRLRGEVDGIMINLPMIPDPEIGMPFTGPLSPVPFEWPQATENTGGTNGTLASHCSLCPLALREYEITVSGIAIRNCALCNSLNGTFILTANDAQHAGSGSYLAASCVWSSPAIPWCTPPAGHSPFVYWILSIASDGPAGATRSHVSWSFDPNGPSGATPDYLYEGCPPAAGSGSGQVTMTRAAGTILNDCKDYPLTITLRGVS